MMKAV
jgi:hypothetical protein